MSDDRLLQKLNGLRMRVRLLLFADGVGVVLAAAMVAAFLAALIDYLLLLPAPARLLIALLVVGGLLVALRRYVMPAILADIDLDEIAGLLDSRFAESEDRLTSAIAFRRSSVLASLPMIRRVVEQADELVERIPTEAVVRIRRPMITVAIAAFLFSGMATIAWAVPGFVRTAFNRYVSPYGSAQWPRRVLIEPLTGDVKRPLGESFEARARIVRGMDASLRVYVWTELTGGQRRRLPMAYDPKAGEYLHSFTGLSEGFSYWFEAGDDVAPGSGEAFRVVVVPRPSVLEAVLEITDPPYVKGSEPRRMTLGDSPVSVVEGSSGRLTVRVNKAVGLDSAGRPRAGVTPPGMPTVCMASIGSAGDRFAAEFPIVTGGSLAVHLVDNDGFDNRGGMTYTLVVRSDELPRVVLVEPPPVVEVTPMATVHVLISVEDDFGITRLALQANVDGPADQPPAVFDLSDRLRPGRGLGRYSAEVGWAWELRRLSLKPGDGVSYQAIATDCFELNGRRHPSVRSTPMRLKVVSPEQLGDRIREEVMHLKGTLRDLLTGQESLLEQAEGIRREFDKTRGLPDPERRSLEQTAARQVQLAARSTHLSGRFRRLVDRIDANRLEMAELRARSLEAWRTLGSLAVGSMKQAGERLQHAIQSSTSPMGQAESLGIAVDAQRSGVDDLRSLLAEMERWGDFQDIIRQVQHLLDQQERQTQSTHRLGQRTIGRQTESLPPPLHAELKDHEKQQRRLAEDVVRLRENLGRMVRTIGPTDPKAGEALDGARRVAEALEPDRRMTAAAVSIAANRMAEAQSEQRAAEEGIRQVLAALERREADHLENLDRQLRGVVERVQGMMGDQQRLSEETLRLKGGSTEELKRRELVERQRGLARSAWAVADELAGVARADGPTRGLRRAGTRMNQAADQLAEGKPDLATSEQDRAMQDMKDVLEHLQKLAAEAGAERAAKSLEAIRDEMKKLRDVQADLNGRLGELVRASSNGQDLSRAEWRRVDRLADQQREVGAGWEKLRARVEAAPVYDWVMRQVGEDIKTLAHRYDQRLLDARSTEMAGDVLEHMTQLVNGLAQELPDIEESPFAEQGGSGQGSPTGKTKSVPTAAELTVLKAMQMMVNRRTRDLDLVGDLRGRNSEAYLEELRQLGNRQEQVRALAEEISRRGMR